jgi:hypothetical protein
VSNIITDAKLVSQYAKKAMEEPEVVITTRAPSDSEVVLPGGFINQNNEVVTTAEVRELNGSDEEAIAKSGSTGKALNVLLQKGLVKLGANPVTSSDLDTLLAGDRDAILIGIRKVTFGDDVDVPVECQHCKNEHTAVISLTADVPVRSLTNSVEDRVWSIETKKGTAVVALPNGIVQKRLMDNYDKTSAEINTLLISGCVVSLNGSPSVGATTALSLSVTDRSKIIESILTRTPGPRLGEVKKACKACGESMDIPLSLTDLFRL